MPSLAQKREAPPVVERELAALYREHNAFVWRILGRFGIPEDLREDVAQEVFVVVYRRWDTWKQEGSARSWLYGIARRVASQHRRSRERAERRERALPPAAELPALDEQLARARAKRALARAIDELEPDRREVFMLAEVDELSAPEIADALGIKLNTVYSRLRLARRDVLAATREHPRKTPIALLVLPHASEIKMLELDSTTRSLLAELRADRDPSAAVTERVWAGVREQLGGPGGGDGGDASGGTGGSQLAAGGAAAAGGATTPLFVAKVVSATLTLTGAGLLTLKLGVAVFTASTSPAPDPIGVTAPQPSIEPSADARASEAATSTVPIEHEAGEALEPAPPEPRPRSRPRTADTGGGVEAEFALLRAARDGETAARTLELLAEHEARFPHGSLVAERELLRIEAACSLGRLQDARTWALRFARRYPNSPLQARVASSCAGVVSPEG